MFIWGIEKSGKTWFLGALASQMAQMERLNISSTEDMKYFHELWHVEIKSGKRVQRNKKEIEAVFLFRNFSSAKEDLVFKGKDYSGRFSFDEELEQAINADIGIFLMDPVSEYLDVDLQAGELAILLDILREKGHLRGALFCMTKSDLVRNPEIKWRTIKNQSLAPIIKWLSAKMPVRDVMVYVKPGGEIMGFDNVIKELEMILSKI